MSNNRLILASASPRRRELLEALGVHPIIKASNIIEEPKSHETHEVYASRNSQEKVLAIANHWKELNVSTALGADTIVISPKGVLFEKPKNPEHAFEMLNLLSGQWHTVITSFSLSVFGNLVHTQSVYTEVKFGILEKDQITTYINSGESLDKSGAYGIQGRSSSFISEIRGSYTNVMGLPMYEVHLALREKTPVRVN